MLKMPNPGQPTCCAAAAMAKLRAAQALRNPEKRSWRWAIRAGSGWPVQRQAAGPDNGRGPFVIFHVPAVRELTRGKVDDEQVFRLRAALGCDRPGQRSCAA